MTPVDICNGALLRLGEARIMALGDANTPARKCAVLFAPTRDQVLRAHRWNFARARAVLSALAQAPAFGWARQFSLPTDCLRVLSLNGDTEEEGAEYEIEGGKLLTDELAAEVRYVARIEDTEKFDPLFCEALTVLLASKLAVALTGSAGKAQELRTEYERLTRPLAVRVDAGETKPRKSYMDGVIHASRTLGARLAGSNLPRTEA
ncbi:hypothetical protein [Prosthecobacter dejongeii]|uniref:Uncharacterized protein n=1 Tax=Prosthecobacter dejongeii TaxID=48465 RepID=A0A7W7YQP0_9BACT|nr:hypothetical protein [Prosthecobacter dejongeii]MBB5040591.1 hypothetical protein [Prosthecobacter dejongeii]